MTITDVDHRERVLRERLATEQAALERLAAETLGTFDEPTRRALRSAGWTDAHLRVLTRIGEDFGETGADLRSHVRGWVLLAGQGWYHLPRGLTPDCGIAWAIADGSVNQIPLETNLNRLHRAYGPLAPVAYLLGEPLDGRKPLPSLTWDTGLPLLALSNPTAATLFKRYRPWQYRTIRT